MEEQEKQEEVVDQVEEVKEEVVAEPEESVEELKQRLENAKAENARKAQELQRLREEADARNKPAEKFNPNDLTTWKDHELKAVLKDPQYFAIHDAAQEMLADRRFHRLHAEREESQIRMNAEMERKKKFPETLDPSHPMAIKMSELMHLHRLDRTPAGYLVAAELAASQLKQQKATAAGRKAEQNRQADVKASFQGDSGRPAPRASDKVKLEELEKRVAQDPTDKAAYYALFEARLRAKGQL